MGEGEFKLARGVSAQNLFGIREEYSRETTGKGTEVFSVNVSAERIMFVFDRLAQSIMEPGFLVIETPTLEAAEKKLRKSDADPLHKDVHYMDGIDKQTLMEILKLYGDLLVNDGMINFGYGGRDGVDEVFVDRYKLLRIFTDRPSKYVSILEELGFPCVSELRTVQSNLSEEHPGYLSVLRDEELTIWEVLEIFKGQGLYFAEHREC